MMNLMLCILASIESFEILNLEYSPIKGPEGNIEYLLYLQNHTDGQTYPEYQVDAKTIVDAAHGELDK